MLLLPATRRDAEVTTALLRREKLPVVCCHTARLLARELDGGVGAILMTDDALADPGIDLVLEALGRQPPWSDIPAIVLCGHDQLPRLAGIAMRTLRNVTLLERPTTIRTLISAVKAAIRARARQYQMRRQFTTLQESEAAVRLRERQLHTLAENTPDILSRFDRQLRHVYVNQAATEVTGLPSRAIPGSNPSGDRHSARALRSMGNRFTRDVRGRSAPPAGLQLPRRPERASLRLAAHSRVGRQRQHRDRAERRA